MMQSDEPPSFLRHSKAFKIGQGNPLSTILPQHLKSAIASILKGKVSYLIRKIYLGV